jgi:hypothetical protein
MAFYRPEERKRREDFICFYSAYIDFLKTPPPGGLSRQRTDPSEMFGGRNWLLTSGVVEILKILKRLPVAIV